MSRTLYTLERRPPGDPTAINSGQILDLRAPDYQILIDQRIHIDQGLLESAFERGISRHGQRHLIDTPLLRSIGAERSVVPNYEPVLELMVELVRRLEFPGHFSRLTSFYGCETTEGAKAFAEAYHGKGPIYEVEVERYQRHDMRFLKLGRTATECWINARDDWGGTVSEDPLWECLAELPVKIGEKVDEVA